MAVTERDIPAIEIPDELPPEVEAFLDIDNAAETVSPPPAAQVMPIVPRIARRRRTLAERRARVQAQFNAEMERLVYWREQQFSRIDKEATRCDLILEAHHAWTLEGDPKAKTLQLPYGVTCRVRAQQPEWLRDEDALLGWALESAPQFVEHRPRLKWADMKKAAHPTPAGGAILPETGEVLPTVQIVKRASKYTVEVELDG